MPASNEALILDPGEVNARLGATAAGNPAVTTFAFNNLSSQFYGLSDAVTALGKQVIRWDQETVKTLNDVAGTSLNYVPGGAYQLNNSTTNYAVGLRPASERPATGDTFAVRVPAGLPAFELRADILQGFGSAGGPKTMVALPGVQYVFHAVLPNANNTLGSYYVVHSVPAGSGSPGGSAFAGFVEERITAFPFTSAGTTNYAGVFGVFGGGLKNEKPSADNSYAPHYTLSFDSAGHVTVTPVGSYPNPIPEGTCIVYTGAAGTGTGTPTPTTKLATPTGLKQTAATSSSVTMSWDPTPDASGYRLRRNGGTVLMPGTATTYTDTGLASGTTPGYEVQALGSGSYSNSDYSASVPATVGAASIDTQAPTAPGAPTYSNITSGGFLVSWTAATDNVGVAGYRLYEGGAQVAGITGTSYGVSGKNASTSYSYYVVAYDAQGNTTASPTTSVTTAAPVTTTPGAGGPPAGYDGLIAPSSGTLRVEENATGYASTKFGVYGTWREGIDNSAAGPSGGRLLYCNETADASIYAVGYVARWGYGFAAGADAPLMQINIVEQATGAVFQSYLLDCSAYPAGQKMVWTSDLGKVGVEYAFSAMRQGPVGPKSQGGGGTATFDFLDTSNS